MDRFEFFEDENRSGFYLFSVDEKIGEITFKWRKEDAISINHTLVFPEFRKKGFGKKMVDKVIEFAEKEGLSLSASCWFADKIIQSQFQ